MAYSPNDVSGVFSGSEEPAHSSLAASEDDLTPNPMGEYEVYAPPTTYPAFPQRVPQMAAPAAVMQPYIPPPVYQQPPAFQQVPVFQVPPGYRLVPLSGDNDRNGKSLGKKILLALVVIGIVAAIVYLVRKNATKAQKEAITPSQAIKKLPTSRLAQNLYQRLARNGKGTRGVMAALDKIAQE